MRSGRPEAGGGSNPEAVVRAFLQALNAHDVERALALLGDEFTFRDAGGGVAIEREAMPSVLGWDAAAEGRLEVLDLDVAADTVRVRLRERNRFTELLGLEPWDVEATFVVREDRIVDEVAREIAERGQDITGRFQDALEPVRRWAETARPDESRAIFGERGLARYDGPTARGLLELIEAYREQPDSQRRGEGGDRHERDR